jgi:NAD(P)-dependent dehydrogenase (short-subunit alcohol dehydrogenase family)
MVRLVIVASGRRQYDSHLMSVKDLFDLTGHVALVTGGSRGLGLDMARGLGEAGASIVITARREQWLTAAGEELRARGITVLTAACDVSNPDQVNAAVKETVDRFGRLDILVNNAGISWGEPIDTMTVEKWRQVFDTNATGCFLMSQAAGREMLRAGRGGSIINIASVAGISGLEAGVLDAVGYSASKGAIIALTRDLAVKWAKQGIRVNAVAPGFFDTRLSHALLEKTRAAVEKTTPMGRIGKPGELSGVAVFLASAAASYITGQVLAVDGGMTA